MTGARGAPAEAFARLSSADRLALSRRYGSRLEELAAIAGETDPELLGESLAAWARRAVEDEDPAAAAAVYDFLAQDGLGLGFGAALRCRAAGEAAALRGEGAFGRRFELLSRGFARQAADPAMIAGMGVAGILAGTVRLGVLSRLAASSRAGTLTRGLGASLLASSSAFAVEVPAFWATQRLVHAAISTQPLSWDRATLFRELASTGMMLGLLKLGGAASGALFNRVHGIAPGAAGTSGLSGFTRLSQPWFRHAGGFAGLYADHYLEERLGWRPRSDAATRGFDTFAAFLQLQVGGRLAGEVLGPGYAARMNELELRNRLAESTLRPPRFPQIFTDRKGLIPVLADAGPGGPRETPEWLSTRPWENGILEMSQLKPERSRSPRGRRTPPPLDSRTGQLPPEQSEETMLDAFRTVPAKSLDRVVKELHERGRLAGLALALEEAGMRPELGPTDFARARERLQDLENRFWRYLEQGRESVPIEKRWERFQAWQNELAPKGMEGLVQMQQLARRLGIGNAFDFKADAIRVKSRVRASQDAADYFLDLALLRDFLREEGLNRVDEANPNGRFLSHLLLNGDGNCVTLSLLFAHLAIKSGRALQVGLLPRHMYLAARDGAAIESTMNFGMSVAAAYRNRAIGPEEKLFPAHSVLGIHLLNLGRGAMERGDLAGARQIVERARDLLPRSPRGELLLGQLAQRMGDFGGALGHYRRAHDLYPQDPKGLNRLRLLAWEHFIAGRYREAEAAFLQLNDRDPEDIDALRGLEISYRRLGKDREAQGVVNLIEALQLGSEEP